VKKGEPTLAQDIILHHYEASLFSEKVRLAFGVKGLAWRSVVIPPVMPRPDLMPLTGGYRRTPVMQIGADVYCDTQIILRELERRFPVPTLYPGASEGLCWAATMLADRAYFQASVAVIFGNLKPADLPAGFVEDRERLSGNRFDFEAMAARGPYARDQWRAYADWIERQLGDDRSFLLGESPSLADLSLFIEVWFLENAYRGAPALLAEFPRLRSWAARLRAIGHGQRSELDSGEALAIGVAAAPATAEREDGADPNGLAPGDRVSVAPDDYGRIPVAGVVVSSSAQHIAIRRRDETAGDVVVHFPRAGFVVARA
jgi:glutathione S-transferase